MGAERLSMRRIKEILRMRLGKGQSVREVARSVGVSVSTVSETVGRARRAEVTWPESEQMDEMELERKLYPSSREASRPLPDFKDVHTERRRKGVTLQLLWEEYRALHPDGYSYSQYCAHYKRFVGKVDVVMRQTHRGGDRMFVDYSGDGIDVTDPQTGEVTECPLFVAALGASSYTYAEVTENEQLEAWIQCHIHAYEYFGGVAAVTVPDQTRTAVSRPCYYEPEINPTYLEMARHYDTVIIPARPYKPRDKAKVETAVLVAQRWIIASLRNHTFFSVAEANEAVAEKLEDLNTRVLKKLDTTRRELFEQLDRPALMPLPSRRYEIGRWARRKVNIDYHVAVNRHMYSVPYQLAREEVETRVTSTTLEVFHRGKREASHELDPTPNGYTTLTEHMPDSHRRHAEWSPSRLISWASRTGPYAAELVERIMAERPHPEQGYRAALGVMRLGKKYGAERLEAACYRAVSVGSYSYRSIKSILQRGLDTQPLPEKPKTASSPIEHDNVRGPDYYN